MVSKSAQRATAKFNKTHYDSITFWVKKGMREKYKAHANELGLSFKRYICNALEQTYKIGE